MTRFILTVGFFTGFHFFALTLSAQELSYDHVESTDLDSIFAEFDMPGKPGCAVGVVDHGELIFAGGYGSANLDYAIPIRPDSRFMIASVSKQFTAAALLMMEQEGKLDLDEDLRTYMPELPEFEFPVTARQLMHHTSGLRDIYNLLSLADIGLDNTTTSAQAVDLISRQQRLNFRPGSRFLYSNTGYFLISVLTDTLTGMSLREYTDKHLFEPSGMSATHFHDDTGMVVPNRVISYLPTPSGPGRFYRDNMDRPGARGLFTTVEDMALWDANFIENKTNLEYFAERMTRAGVTRNGNRIDYASGLRLSRYKTLRTVGHGGSYMGFRTNYMRFPDYEFAVITFCNKSDINPATYSYKVADLYLKQAFDEQFQEYPGRYGNANFGVDYRVLLKDGDLYLKRGRNEKERLIWNDNDEFSTGNLEVTFSRNSNGRIGRMQIKSPRTGPITFTRNGEYR
jgi:CubicO group peptidase (beta-lactamase class C family)